MIRCTLVLAALALAAPQVAVAQAATPIPHLETRNGRHALIVDGAPFTILGGQVNNSSNYPDALQTAWPVLDRVHANTVEVPIAWQQVVETVTTTQATGRRDATFTLYDDDGTTNGYAKGPGKGGDSGATLTWDDRAGRLSASGKLPTGQAPGGLVRVAGRGTAK